MYLNTSLDKQQETPDKDVFSSCHECGTRKKNISPHEESNLRPSDSARTSAGENKKLTLGTNTTWFRIEIYINAASTLNQWEIRKFHLYHGWEWNSLSKNAGLISFAVVVWSHHACCVTKPNNGWEGDIKEGLAQKRTARWKLQLPHAISAINA